MHAILHPGQVVPAQIHCSSRTAIVNVPARQPCRGLARQLDASLASLHEISHILDRASSCAGDRPAGFEARLIAELRMSV